MKIIESSAGALTNFEVLDLLRSRGAGNDPTRVIASVSPSEFKVFDYLEGTVACNQTREVVKKMAEECGKYDLAKAEILNIINIRPATEVVEIFPIIDEIEERIDEEKMDELKAAIAQILPPHPSQVESNGEEIGADDTAEPVDDQQAEKPLDDQQADEPMEDQQAEPVE